MPGGVGMEGKRDELMHLISAVAAGDASREDVPGRFERIANSHASPGSLPQRKRGESL